MKTSFRALNDIGLRHAAEFLDLLYSNRRQSEVFKTGDQHHNKLKGKLGERNCMKALDRRCLSDSGISLASTASISAHPIWSHNSAETPRKDIFRLHFERGQPHKSFSGIFESSFRLSNRDHKLNWSVQDLMSRGINGIECRQNGISMHDRSNQIYPNSGEFCSKSSNIQDRSCPIPNTNHSSQKQKRTEKGKINFELKAEPQIEVGLVLVQSGGQNGTFLNQDECDQTLDKLNKCESESEGEENGHMENDTLRVSPKVKDLPHNSPVLEYLGSGNKTSEQLLPSYVDKDLTQERVEPTDPVLDFRVQSPEDGYFSNKEETLENPSPVKKKSLGVSATNKVGTLEKGDYDSMLDSSLEMDSSLQTISDGSRIQDQNSSSDPLLNSSLETDELLQVQFSELAGLASNSKVDLDSSLEINALLESQSFELPQLGSNTEGDLNSSWQTYVSPQISLSKTQEVGSNIESELDICLENNWSALSPKTEEHRAVQLDSLLQIPSSRTSLDSLTGPETLPPLNSTTVENLECRKSLGSCSLKTAEGKHPLCHSSPKRHHPAHSDLKTSSSSLEDLPRPSSVGERESSGIKSDERPTLLSRGMTISLDLAGTSVSFDERGHIVPLQEVRVSGGRRGKGKGVFETLFRPDPRYWPKLLAAGWTKRGAREQRQVGSKYATVRGFLKRRHSLSKSFHLARRKGEVGFYFDNLVTILKAAVVAI